MSPSPATVIQKCSGPAAPFTGVFALPTPVNDASGVAHVCEHLVFRRSLHFPEAHNLFAALALLPLRINASTQDEMTFYFVETDHEALFYHALSFLYSGLLNQQYSDDDIRREKNGVIFQELDFYEQKAPYRQHVASLLEEGKYGEAFTGGFTGTVPQLTTEAVRQFKSRYYRPDNITLLINNGDTGNIADKLNTVAGDYGYSVPCQIKPESLSVPSEFTPDNSDSDKHSEEVKRLTGYYKATLEVQNNVSVNAAKSSAIKFAAPTEKPDFEALFRGGKPALLPPLISDETASLVTTATSFHQAFLQSTAKDYPPLPRYVLAQWPSLVSFEQIKAANNDWYIAFPFSDSRKAALDKLLMQSGFWSPRISGHCYAMGTGRAGDMLVCYFINDRLADSRMEYCHWLITALK